MQKTMTGACLYCGQVQTLACNDDMEETTADEYITMHCSCAGAKRRRMEDEQAENLRMLFGEESAADGFEPETEETVNALSMILLDIQSGSLAGISALLPSGDVAKLKRVGNHGRISITRVSKRQASM